MRDEKHGLAALLPQLEELVLHVLPRLHIKRAEGLVHQQDTRADDPALRDGNPLAHAARELMREPVLEAGEPDPRDEGARLCRGLARRHAAEVEPEPHIVEDRAPRQQRILLKQIGGVAIDRKSTRLNSSHQIISYAVFCLKKKNSSVRAVSSSRSTGACTS